MYLYRCVCIKSLSNCVQICAYTYMCERECVFECVFCLPAYLDCEVFNGSNISLHVNWLIMKNGVTIIHPKPPLHCHSSVKLYSHINTPVLFPSLKVKLKKWRWDFSKEFKFSPKLFLAFLFFSVYCSLPSLLFFLSLTISPFNLHCDSLQGWSSRAVTMNLCGLNKINYCYLYPHISERVINAGGLAC